MGNSHQPIDGMVFVTALTSFQGIRTTPVGASPKGSVLFSCGELQLQIVSPCSFAAGCESGAKKKRL
jgi:hypothetical protein